MHMLRRDRLDVELAFLGIGEKFFVGKCPRQRSFERGAALRGVPGATT